MICGTFCLFLLLAAADPVRGGWLSWNGDILVTIDGSEYTAEDYHAWWKNWREPGMDPPETPGPFIDWMLLLREAEKMRLYEDPGYRRKVLTFLKARTLMLLKAEEVDSKIEITDDELWQRYRENYVPLYQLNILFFDSRENADAFLEEIDDRKLADGELKDLVSREKGLLQIETGWHRKVSVDPGWHDIISGLREGYLSSPVDSRQGVVVLRLQDKKDGDREDFATVRKEIENKLWKERSDQLTRELLKNLREKYNVSINRERISKLDINAPPESFSGEPVVTTSHGTISEQEFMAQLRRTMKYWHPEDSGEEAAEHFKMQVINGIIDQTLTSWEGLARGYEKEPPFEDVYVFYCQHRMIRALEEKIFKPQVKVTPEDVRAHYEAHIERYSRPETVRLVHVEGSHDDMSALWTAVAMGGDLRAVAMERFERTPAIREVPLSHLDPEVRGVVEKLTREELSPVFPVNGHAGLVQLIDRTPAQPQPFATVSGRIHEQLHEERLNKVREEYLQRLRAGSSIEVNEEVWRQINKEMEQADADETK
jgi:hypothetical protein